MYRWRLLKEPNLVQRKTQTLNCIPETPIKLPNFSVWSIPPFDPPFNPNAPIKRTFADDRIKKKTKSLEKGEGTENRIAVERRKFNEAARSYNTSIKLFPKNMIANMFGFEKKPYFKSQEGSEEAPKVEF